MSPEIAAQIEHTRQARICIDRADWKFDVRELVWPYNGDEYRINQFANNAGKTRTVVKTLFYRNDKLHRLDGPAYDFKFSEANMEKKFYVDGKLYSELEFNFFVKAMIA